MNDSVQLLSQALNLSNALLRNEPDNCLYGGPQDGLNNDTTIFNDILSRKLLEANFEGKSVRAIIYNFKRRPDRVCVQKYLQHCFIELMVNKKQR